MWRALRAGLALALLLTVAHARAAEPAIHPRPARHLLGDVHPLFVEGECFLFHLRPGDYRSCLLRSRDLLRWTESPLEIDPAGPGVAAKPYFVLGVFRDPDAGLWRSSFGDSGAVAASESDDLLHWRYGPSGISIPPAAGQRRRDPCIVRDEDRRLWRCVMTARLPGLPEGRDGAIVAAESADLRRWCESGTLVRTGAGVPECPQAFRLGGRWWLLASIYDRAVGGPSVWRGGSFFGGFDAGPPVQLDGKDCCAAQIAFDGETPVLFGWVPATAARPGEQTWGGVLALPREVFVAADGTLATRFHAGVAAAIRGGVLATGTCIGPGTACRLPLPGGEPRRLVDVDVTVTAEHDDASPRVRVTLAGDDGTGAEIVIGEDRLVIIDAQGTAWADVPLRRERRRERALRIVVDGDIVEAFLDGETSLVARLPGEVACRSVVAVPPRFARVATVRAHAVRSVGNGSAGGE